MKGNRKKILNKNNPLHLSRFWTASKLVLGICVPLLLLYLYSLGKRKSTPEFNSPMAASMELFLINPTVKATASVIFLHGLGDNGSGWYHAFNELKKNNIRYLFPNAPSMPVTLNGGFVMPSWFDLKGLDPNVAEDVKGIKTAAERIRALIKKENEEHGIPYNKIVLGGFSMGGSLALYTALTEEEQLAGVVALSSWLPLHKQFAMGKDNLSLKKQQCKIFQGHGGADPMVPENFGRLTHSILSSAREDLGADATKIKVYPAMGHQSCDEEMDDVTAFINTCLE